MTQYLIFVGKDDTVGTVGKVTLSCDHGPFEIIDVPSADFVARGSRYDQRTQTSREAAESLSRTEDWQIVDAGYFQEFERMVGA